MKSNENIHVAFRHLKDSDRLEIYGLNGPIEAGQAYIAREIADRILSLAPSRGCRSINLLYSNQRRTQESTELVQKIEQNIKVLLRQEDGLREMSRGMPHLPQEYKNGDFFTNSDGCVGSIWGRGFY